MVFILSPTTEEADTCIAVHSLAMLSEHKTHLWKSCPCCSGECHGTTAEFRIRNMQVGDVSVWRAWRKNGGPITVRSLDSFRHLLLHALWVRKRHDLPLQTLNPAVVPLMPLVEAVRKVWIAERT